MDKNWVWLKQVWVNLSHNMKKTNKVTLHPPKTQISLGEESSLGALNLFFHVASHLMYVSGSDKRDNRRGDNSPRIRPELLKLDSYVSCLYTVCKPHHVNKSFQMFFFFKSKLLNRDVEWTSKARDLALGLHDWKSKVWRFCQDVPDAFEKCRLYICIRNFLFSESGIL